MTFWDYEEMTKDFTDDDFPIGATNQYNEPVIITKGERDGERFFKTMTAQNNDWLRINYYYEDGRIEELYEK